MECRELQKSIGRLDADTHAIVTAWVNSDLAAEKFKRNAINRKFFARHFGVRVMGHLLNVINGSIRPGECPVITVMLMFFKEKSIPLSDIFIICSALREQLVEYFMKQDTLSMEIYREIAFLIDRNFEGVIQEFFEICVEPACDPATGRVRRAEAEAGVKVRVTVSAAEFLQNNIFMQDDIDELSELAEDVETLLFDHETLDETVFEKIKSVFEKYAQIVSSFYEFQELGYSLTVLAGVLSNYGYGDIKADDRQKVHVYLESIIGDLSKWRKHIFIDRDAIDINYLDDSLLTSIAMFEVLLTSQENGDEGDLELF